MAWDLGSRSQHHASEAGGSGSRLRPRQRDFLNIGRQRDANRLKELTGDTGGGGAQQEALAILLELDLLQPVEIAQDVAPFSGNPLPAEAIFEFFGEQQRQKRAEHMAADRHVAAVVDRAGGEHGLGLAQQLLDPQQVAVAPHDLQWGDLSVGTQYVEPVEARVVGDPCLVDGEVPGRWRSAWSMAKCLVDGEVPGRDGLEITAEAAVADQRLVALGELGAQPVEDRSTLLGIAASLGEIATDDVPDAALARRRAGPRNAPTRHTGRDRRRQLPRSVPCLWRSRHGRYLSSGRADFAPRSSVRRCA